MDERIIYLLKNISGDCNVLTDEPMSRHTSFRIGGPAEALVFPRDACELGAVIGLCRNEGVPLTVMGNGTNMLVSDEGIDGVVLNTSCNMTGALQCDTDPNLIICGAGTMLSVVAKRAAQLSLSGMEFAEGIPGTVGGAVAMNAGAYNGEMSFVTDSVTCVCADGSMKVLSGDEHMFAYRSSVYQKSTWETGIPDGCDDDRLIICSVNIRLKQRSESEIRAMMRDFADRRRSKQPIEKPSAGSTFRRPANGYAAQLIEECGLKGFRIGGAQVSEKHSGFIINTGGASCDDVLALIGYIRDKVYNEKGIMLETEVKLLGRRKHTA